MHSDSDVVATENRMVRPKLSEVDGVGEQAGEVVEPNELAAQPEGVFQKHRLVEGLACGPDEEDERDDDLCGATKRKGQPPPGKCDALFQGIEVVRRYSCSVRAAWIPAFAGMTAKTAGNIIPAKAGIHWFSGIVSHEHYSPHTDTCDGWLGGPDAVVPGPPSQPEPFDARLPASVRRFELAQQLVAARDGSASSPSCADLSPAQIDSSSSLMMSRIWTKLPKPQPPWSSASAPSRSSG